VLVDNGEVKQQEPLPQVHRDNRSEGDSVDFAEKDFKFSLPPHKGSLSCGVVDPDKGGILTFKDGTSYHTGMVDEQMK